MSNIKGSHTYSEEDIQSWGVNDVAQWLVSLKLDSCVKDFMSAHIDGQRLLLLTWEEFKTLHSLKDDKRKKLLKKGLSQLPGRSAAEGKAKGKKFGRGKKSKQKNVSLSHPPPVTSYPPQQTSYNDDEIPALPPRPAKLGSSPYPLQSQPQPLSHGPQAPIMRPPISSASSYQDTGYGEESDDIYDAVPDIDIELEESEEIYDGEDDSFSEDDEIEEEYEESNTIQQRHSQLFALQARLVAHGIGSLEQGGIKPNQYNDEEDDGEIYDIPPDMEPSPGFLQQQGFGGYSQPPPPPGAPPPPPPGAPPPDDFESDEIYDLPPEQDGGHSYPQVQPPTDEFGYAIDEEIYDIADEELPHLQPPQNMPHPPQSMPHLPQSVPHPPQGMSRPPMRPPIPPEDTEGDEIYDCMEDIELIEEEPQPVSQPQIGMGMRPQMRPPILQQSTSPTNLVPPPPMRPPINQPSGAVDVQKSKLNSFANQPCPPRPSSNTKPGYNQQTAQEKIKAVANQPPPPRPSSSSKPQAPPVAPPSPSQLSDKEEEDVSGGLASQLAAMKKKLRNGSNISPSMSPPTTLKNISGGVPGNTSKSKPFSPQPGSSTSGGDLASSIAKARQSLRAGSSSTSPPKSIEEEKLSLKPSNLPPKRDSVESSNKLTTPPHSPKPPLKTTKPSFPNKPALLKKPPVAPKSNKIANLMKSFQTQEDPASHPTPLPLSSPERKAIKTNHSPMTGRKLNRDQSVKELTQRYSSPEPEESSNNSVSLCHRPSSPPGPQPGPSSAGSIKNSNTGNVAINKFRRKQLEIEEEEAPPRPPPINSSKVAAKFSSKPPLEIPPSEESKPPLFLKREELPSKAPISSPQPIPSPVSNSSPPPLPKRPLPTIPPSDNEPLPPPIKDTPRPSLPFSLSEETTPALPSRPPPTPNSNQPPLPSRPGNMRPPPLPVNDIAPPLPNRPLPGRSNLEPQQSLKPPLPPPVESQPQEPPRPMKASHIGLPVGQSWYHAGLDRKNAEAKIRRYQKDGTFIVRDNTKNPGEYSLSLWFEGGVRHLRIRKRADNTFVLGEEKADEMPFANVVELITYYKTEPVVLKSGGQTPLKYECPR